MGYTTTYFGRFDLDKPLTEPHAAYLHRFAKTRRMQRVQLMLTDALDPWRVNAGLPLGEEGEYYTGGEIDTGRLRRRIAGAEIARRRSAGARGRGRR